MNKKRKRQVVRIIIYFLQINFSLKNHILFQNERGSGIIYCRTRELTEEVATVLSMKGVPTVSYHAGIYLFLMF